MPDRLPWLEVGEAAAAIAVILVGGRFLVRPAFRVIGGARTPEVFTALALLVVVGTASLAHAAGLSMSLGAFLGGVLLSDSEYRHELQADIEPFEGLLLGFFFISVGMSANLPLALHEPWFFAAAVPGLMLAKIAVAFPLGRAAAAVEPRPPSASPRAAAGQRVQLRAVLGGGRGGRADAGSVRPRDLGDRAVDGRDAAAVRRRRSGC